MYCMVLYASSVAVSMYCFQEALPPKKKNKKLQDADLVTYVPVSSIRSPDYAGFAHLQFGVDPWTRFWCVAYSNCLYIYQNQSATATVKTVVLLGYDVKVSDLHGSKYPYNIVLKHDGISPVCMSVTDKEELDKWAKILEGYTRVEGSVKQRKVSGKLLPAETSKVLSHKSPSKTLVGHSTKGKGPVKADHAINTQRSAKEVCIYNYLCCVVFETACGCVCVYSIPVGLVLCCASQILVL